MQQELLTTYADLMDKLAHAPDEMAAVQERITALSLDQADVERTMKNVEFAAVEAAGGYSALGNNDKVREGGRMAVLSRSAQYQAQLARQINLARDLAVERGRLDDLTRRWAGLGFQARLHAALLAYLGASGAPAALKPEVNFYPERGNDTAYVTAADASALGL